MKTQTAWSRRAFLGAIGGTGAALMLQPFSSLAMKDVDPRVAKIVAGTIGIDTHNHVDVPLTADALPGPGIDLAGAIKRSGLSAICMTFAVDYKKLTPEEGYDRFITGITAMDQVLAKNNMTRALNMADLRKAHQHKKPVVIQSVEGGHFLNGKIERMQIAYDRGLRHLTLLHDSDASVPLGDVYTNPPVFGGLTTFGAAVIKECNRLGILIDLAHCDQATVIGALKVAQHPIFISHTGLDTQLGNNPNFANMMRPRLISKETAKIVADAGGVIGVWTHLADTPVEYAQHVRALVDVVGVDHVCIGTDTKIIHTKAPWDNFYYTVVDAMLKTGFTETEIGRIGGGNFCRVFDTSTK